MTTIAVVWSNRSEEGLIRPVIDELREAGFDVWEWKMPDSWFEVQKFFESQEGEIPDYAICPFDRPPVALAAFLFYHGRVPIIQLQAGDISSGTFDDVDRHVITLMASIHFCSGEVEAERVRRLLLSVNLPCEKVFVSGITNLDGVVPEEAPDGTYDVVIYNPPTISPEKMPQELDRVFNMLDKETYWIQPNGDEGSQYIYDKVVKQFARLNKNIRWTPTLSHGAYLGLISRAKRVIGNSSSLFFEVPFFEAERVLIGERNRIRESVELRKGGSKVIAEKLKELILSKT